MKHRPQPLEWVNEKALKLETKEESLQRYKTLNRQRWFFKRIIFIAVIGTSLFVLLYSMADIP